MAFVAGTGSNVSAIRGVKASVSSRPVQARKTARAGRVIVTAQISEDAQKGVPQLGWFRFNEKLNGRLAMIGFVLGLVTEVVAPGHPSIISQVLALIPTHIKVAMTGMF
mmetsp:Transcript_5600/g.15011  ORF Transcript_5600/g.15011 Transcript_5600/m.15011 type:complete len:109 (+) Transcript_5600:376-702(+)|eukprot:CAMPEP_0185830022 /NCGR_PEP_ID=MMETSP1353-20130828/586_1 /TAXON_ID=1077150 /ORGANISM="Erythrolobus australicus, Strain CCMP3124" /LENGTH=108 /DNA_ID=CAMNT_0028527875 /DNA_START=376 /DNA_END=702 /DNA_ORIENTATION=+